MDRAQQILKDFPLDFKNKGNEDNRNLMNLMDMGETFGVLNVLNYRININFLGVSKNEYSAGAMHITIINVLAIVTIGAIV